MPSGRIALASAALCVAALAGCAGPDPAGPGPAAPGPTSSSSSAPAPSSPPSCVDTVFDRLPAEQRWAQLVVAGVPASGVSGAARDALGAKPGGIILTDGDGVTPRTVAATVRDARAAGGSDLLVSTDQEGGQVQELAGPGFTPIPAASAQSGEEDLRAQAATWGRQLAGAGVDVDLAPVADVVDPALGRDNATDGRYGRQYGTDVTTASRGVDAFTRGMLDARVAPTLKHFPGLGKVRQNTDFAGGVSDTVTTADDRDLGSFRAGIAAGAPLVMMSSARYARIDPANRALFSRTIMQGLLRDRLGFGGVIMTDDVGAAEALADVPVGARATRFLAAGGDLVLTVRPDDVRPMVAAIATAARDVPGFRERAEDAVHRVLALKQDRGLLRCE